MIKSQFTKENQDFELDNRVVSSLTIEDDEQETAFVRIVWTNTSDKRKSKRICKCLSPPQKRETTRLTMCCFTDLPVSAKLLLHTLSQANSARK